MHKCKLFWDTHAQRKNTVLTSVSTIGHYLPPSYTRYNPPSPNLVKSIELFRNRHVLSLAEKLLPPDSIHEWLAHALSVQLCIYDIDHYFEHTEALSVNRLSLMWETVERVLSRAPGRPNETSWLALARLRRYETMEKRIHATDKIDPREYHQLVSCKISDVAIARALIWSYGKSQRSRREIEFWKKYDEAGEVIEDILDIYEDGNDWNFNFWLYPYMTGSLPLMDGGEIARTFLRRILYELELSQVYLPGYLACSLRPFVRSMTILGNWIISGGWTSLLKATARTVKRYSELIPNEIAELTSQDHVVGPSVTSRHKFQPVLRKSA